MDSFSTWISPACGQWAGGRGSIISGACGSRSASPDGFAGVRAKTHLLLDLTVLLDALNADHGELQSSCEGRCQQAAMKTCHQAPMRTVATDKEEDVYELDESQL